MPKKDIHPKYYPQAPVVVNGETVMTTGSTKPELRLEVWSGNHPFYTGEQRILDTAGQVDRFMRRLQTSQSKQSEAQKRRESKVEQPVKKASLYQEVYGEATETPGDEAPGAETPDAEQA